MAHISTETTGLLLGKYGQYRDELNAIINEDIPNLYFAEKDALWRGDRREAEAFRKARERFARSIKGCSAVLTLCRTELVRRNPEYWGSLAATVEPDLEQYKRPWMAYAFEDRNHD